MTANLPFIRDRSRKMGLYRVGAQAAIAGLTSEETGTGPFRQTVFYFNNTPVTMADEPAIGAYGGVKLYTMPDGLVDIVGAVVDLTATKSGSGINADFDGDVAMGTAVASTGVSLTGTQANIIPSTAIPQAVFSVATVETVTSPITLTDESGGEAATTIPSITDNANSGSADLAPVMDAIASLAAMVNRLKAGALRLDGTSAASDIYLNFLIDDADQDGGGTLLLNGSIAISWVNHGDTNVA